MRNEEYGIVAFESTTHAIKGEKILKGLKLKFKTIPTPREISLSCGLSIRFDLKDLNIVNDTIGANNLAVKGIYRYIKRDSANIAEKIN
jgi:hypothetical protein